MINDMFIPEETDVLAQIPSARASVIDTPLVRIEFKNLVVGDNEVNGSRGLFPVDIYNILTDKLCIGIASAVVRIQRAICGDEAIYDKTAKLPSAMFDGTTLKEEYSATKTDAQCITAERDYAEIIAYNATIQALVQQYFASFPNSKNGVQFAFVGTEAAKRTGFETGPIYDVKRAVEFRILSNPSRLAALNLVERRRKGGKEVDALEQVDVRKMLGI